LKPGHNKNSDKYFSNFPLSFFKWFGRWQLIKIKTKKENDYGKEKKTEIKKTYHFTDKDRAETEKEVQVHLFCLDCWCCIDHFRGLFSDSRGKEPKALP
jgi:hypothetical protein